MRVIAGKAKGRRLRTVPGDKVRPISDRVKESLFNILGADIQGASFLDLFAGTGSVGVEALSRGAAYVRFIDRDGLSVRTVLQNLKITGLEGGAQVQRADAFAYLEGTPDRAFDYLYIAPPQYQDLWVRALKILDIHLGWLAADAWVIAQIHPVEYTALKLANLGEFDQRRYGSTMLVFYEILADQINE